MFIVLFLIEPANVNLLLSFMPESVALLVGVSLIGVSAGLRKVFKRRDAEKLDENSEKVAKR